MSKVVPMPGAKAPPDLANPEAEAAFLGAVMRDNTLLDRLDCSITPTDFHEPTHARTFAKILELRSRGERAYPVSLRLHLEQHEVKYLAALTGDIIWDLPQDAYASQIRELSDLRQTAAAIALAGEQLSEPGADQTAVLARLAAAIEAATPARRLEATQYQWRDPASIPPRPWVLGRWLLLCTVATVIAPGGVGKTTFLATAALSVATGRSLLGKDVWGGRKRVWIWNLEDDHDELARAIQAAALHYRLGEDDLAGWLFVDSALEGKGLCTATVEDGAFRLLTPIYAGITAELKRRRIDVLIVDPFVSSHEVEENDNARIDKIAKAWARVAKDANCVIVLVHHANKAGSGEVTALSARGASSLVNAARSTLVLNRMDETEAQRLGIPAEERRRYLRVQDDKANRAPAAAADWFRLVGVDLGNGTVDLPGDSVAVAEPWKLPDPFDDVSVSDLRAVQQRLGSGQWRESPQASAWVGKLVAEVLGIDIEDRAEKAKVKSIVSQWIKNGALRIEEAADANREMRKFIVSGDPA